MRAAAVVAALSLLAACGSSDDSSTAGVGSSSVGGDGGAETAAAGSDSGVFAVSETVAASTEANVEPHDAVDVDQDGAEVVTISLGAEIGASSDGVSIDGTTVTITSAGTYELSGTLTDGEIVVDAGDDSVVQLVLAGVEITNTDGAAIAVLSADTAVVSLADGAANTLTDGAVYALVEGEDEPNAALFSAADLTVAGTGSLTVIGNSNDGIASKDGLVIEGGSVTVSAVDDGIRGKDYLIVEGGELEVTAGGDGLKADNDEDPERGYIAIEGGLVTVTSGDDGVQAASDVLITGGTLDVSAGSTGASDDARAVQGDVLVAIGGGTIRAEASDDAVHSNSTVVIDGGDLTLASGDDGIHGDLFVEINGGSILITESFEGIESEVITINDGFIDVTSNDDGLNVASSEAAAVETEVVAAPAGGRGGGPLGGPGGGDAGVGDYYIYINGGTTVITVTGALAEQGDGIDANGHVEMSGGVVVVSGPTDTRNSAIDYSGGSFVLTGGLLVGTNIDGRNSEGIGAGSTQPSLYLTFDSILEAGTLVEVRSTTGESLVTFEPANQFDVVVFSSPELTAGETYEIYLGGTADGSSSTGLYETAESGSPAGTAVAT